LWASISARRLCRASTRWLEEYTWWIDLFELPSDLENIFVPTACLGDYRTRILIGSLWPIGLLSLFAVGFVCWELLQRSWHKVEGASRSIRIAVIAGLQRVLPLTLRLTFLVVPSACQPGGQARAAGAEGAN
jgi:hypothetical protein